MVTKYGVLLVSGLLLGLPRVSQAQSASRLVSATTNDATVSDASATPEVLTYADEMPAFTGGDAALHQYLAKKINYPTEANQRNLSGTVYVRFVVDEQGRVRDAEVAKGSGYGFDEEALRVVRLMPWWVPGRVAGKPVRVIKTLPIIFRLSR